MTKTISGTGAEAVLIHSDGKLIKDRIPKSYRLPILDEKIRKSRTKSEAKLLEKAKKLIPIPKVISTDSREKIEMQFIKGLKLSENLDTLKNAEEICKTIGKQIAILHDNNIIHGDLTTSNMIYTPEENKLYFIDFGLGYISARAEDKAVDLHLIKQALEAKHFKHFEKFFRAVLDGYKTSKTAEETLNRLKKVEARGRYKQAE